MDTKTEQSVCVYDVTSKATKKTFLSRILALTLTQLCFCDFCSFYIFKYFLVSIFIFDFTFYYFFPHFPP